MPSAMLLIGVAIFGASVFLILGLLVAHGGANKMRQFAVLGDLLAGRHGARMRGLLIGAFGGLVVGALTSFAAVAINDAAQAGQCQSICVERGFEKGTIGLSTRLNDRGRSYKICRCSGGGATDQEIDLSELPE
jgi:hypothetical protein